MHREGKLRGGESSSKGRQKQTQGGCRSRHCGCHCAETQKKSFTKGRRSNKTLLGFRFSTAFRASSLAQLPVDHLVQYF